MVNNYAISIFLDARRAKENGKFPVKLRVYTSTPRRQKLYPTKFEFSKDEFKSIWLTEKPRREHKPTRQALKAVEVHAIETAEKISPFSFDIFEKRLFRKVGDGVRVSYQYNEEIKKLLKNQRIGTADNYTYSQKSLKRFIEGTKRGKFDNLTFYEITPDILNEYQQHLVEQGRSLTTVGIYLRPLRAVFNKAIEDKEIDKSFYPFGKHRYSIPSTSNKKKALSHDQLATLFKAEAVNEQQQIAKDFWFFSFASNGMNTKDIALLKWKNIDQEKISFYRAKTEKTSQSNLKEITVFLNDYIKLIIDKYGKDERQPNKLVFSIVSESQTKIEQHRTINNFNRFMGQHIKRLAVSVGLPEGISPYWARHSFATNSVRNGATMEFMQEAMGHENKATTQRYFAGFDDDTKKEFAESLMNFD